MLAGQEGNEPVYVAQLILKPNCLLPAANSISLWFSDLLTSLGDKFNMLTQATYKLDDWMAHAKIMCYHHIDTERHKIKEQMAVL